MRKSIGFIELGSKVMLGSGERVMVGSNCAISIGIKNFRINISIRE